MVAFSEISLKVNLIPLIRKNQSDGLLRSKHFDLVYKIMSEKNTGVTNRTTVMTAPQTSVIA